jgi:hypothetical protein
MYLVPLRVSRLTKRVRMLIFNKVITPKKSKKNEIGEWRSLVAHLHGVQGVAGSNPVSPMFYLV